MLPASSTQPLATLDDLLAIPDEERDHEIVDGELVERASPSGEHGHAQRKVGVLVDPFDHRPGGPWPGGWWIVVDVEIELAPHQVFRPDLSGWRRERMPDRPSGFPVRIRPDWVCEIVSPGNAGHVRKLRRYHQSGVPHYWFVDPVGQTLTVHRRTDEGYLVVLVAERGETVRAEPFDAIETGIGDLFGDEETQGQGTPRPQPETDIT